MYLQGKTIVVGVCGGIAAYKACEVVSRLKKLGAQVHVVMTQSAQEFVTPLTFQTLSKNLVITDMFATPGKWEVEHVSLAQKADCFLVAPATANIIGKMANGLADDMLSTTLMATRKPILVAPAMNTGMYENDAVIENIEKLKGRGIQIVEPEEGLLACGDIGKGRLAEPSFLVEEVVKAIAFTKDLRGKTILVTAGATREFLDPVRYLTNPSSGKMGIAIARASKYRGAKVILVRAATTEPSLTGVEEIVVTSAEEMYEAVLSYAGDADMIIKAAAVGDYRFRDKALQKLKKGEDTWTVALEKNPDILKTLGQRKKENQVIVGFSMETQDIEKYATQKMIEKNVDLMVANDVTQEGAGFGTDTNVVKLFTRDGKIEAIDQISKDQLAHIILEKAKSFLNN